jgi:DNA-binding protein HU-beta
VNKTQLIDALSARYEGNRKAAAHALESVLDTITREVAKGEKVAITGFGSFEKRIRDARWVRNPRTGERMKAKKTAIPKFTPGQDLKNVISGAKKLPKLTAARAAQAPAAAVAATRAAASKATTSRTTASATAKKAPAKTSSAAKKTSGTAKKTTGGAAKKSSSTAKKTGSAAKKTTGGAAKKSSSTAKKTAKKTPAKKS